MFVAGLLTQQIAPAQGVVYLSNLGQASAGNLAVGSNSWQAAVLITGTNVGGYALNSVQLRMTDASNSPSGFKVMLYGEANNPNAAFPGSSLGTLFGANNPSTGGVYTYTDDSNITLSSDTTYFIVLTAGTTIADGAYDWSSTSTGSYGSYNPTGGWIGGNVLLHSSNGSSWAANSSYSPQFSITATAIPEPGVLSLFALGGLGFLWQRRRFR